MHKNILKSLALMLLIGKIDTASAGILGISITCDGERTNINHTYYNPVNLLERYPAGHTIETKINNHGQRGVFLKLATLEPQKNDIQSLDFSLENNKKVSFVIQKHQPENGQGIVVEFQKKVNGQPTDNPIRFTINEPDAKDPNFKPWVKLIAGDTDVRFVNTQANPS